MKRLLRRAEELNKKRLWLKRLSRKHWCPYDFASRYTMAVRHAHHAFKPGLHQLLNNYAYKRPAPGELKEAWRKEFGDVFPERARGIRRAGAWPRKNGAPSSMGVETR